jgi:hypothetical protein
MMKGFVGGRLSMMQAGVCGVWSVADHAPIALLAGG